MIKMHAKSFVRFYDAQLAVKTHKWIQQAQVYSLKGSQGILGNVGNCKLKQKQKIDITRMLMMNPMIVMDYYYHCCYGLSCSLSRDHLTIRLCGNYFDVFGCLVEFLQVALFTLRDQSQRLTELINCPIYILKWLCWWKTLHVWLW